MELTVHGFSNGDPIPGQFAFCIPAAEDHVTFADNKNPRITWGDMPEGTQSLALIVVDPDAPTKPDDVNQEGKTVPYDLPRADFYHLALVDIPPSVTDIPEGGLSQGVTPKGKPVGQNDFGIQGINDYTSWFQGDPSMEGVYGGYDGPCPPWNDERIHRYYFRLFALSEATLGLSGEFTAQQVLEAMAGKVLAEAEWLGTYTLYPEAR